MRWYFEMMSMWGRSADKETQAETKSPCRICHSSEETRGDLLVAPCSCDGSLRYVHNSCQQAWLCARRGPLEYRCELCQTELSHRLTLATRFELVAVSTTSVVVWVAQVASASRLVQLAVQLLSMGWKRRPEGWATGVASSGVGGTFGALRRFLQRPSSPTVELALAETCNRLAQHAWGYMVVTSLVVVAACVGMSVLRRPLMIVGEDAMTKFCCIKIGGCVLTSLHELLRFPLATQPAPFSAYCVIGATLLLDTLLLSFLRIPRVERLGWGLAARLAKRAFRLIGDFLPFAALFFLWWACIVVIVVASLVPCMALLFREVLKQGRQRCYRHGSIQLAVFVARSFTHLIVWAQDGWSLDSSPRRGPRGAAKADGSLSKGVIGTFAASLVSMSPYILMVLWMLVEAIVLCDLVTYNARRRRGIRPGTNVRTRLDTRVNNCARDGLSQVMWCIGIAGQAFLTVLAHMNAASSPGSSGGTSPDLPHRRQPHRKSTGFFLILQDVALLVCFTSFLQIHLPVLLEWARQSRRALRRWLTQFDPEQVAFYDRPPTPALRRPWQTSQAVQLGE